MRFATPVTETVFSSTRYSYLQAFSKRLTKALLFWATFNSKVDAEIHRRADAANLGLGAMKSQFDHSYPIFFGGVDFFLVRGSDKGENSRQ